MANIPKSILQLLVELSKYYSQKALGEGASSIVADGITELVGEDVTGQINNFLSKEKNAKQLLKAFREADDCFIKSSADNLIRQAIISKPFSAIQRLENIAIQLPSTLNDGILFIALRDQFKKDWPKKLSEQQLDIAATQYRICLDRALATKLDQLLPTIFRKVERIEKDVRQIKDLQSDFQQQIQNFEGSTFRQSELLLQQIMGISNQVAIQNLELSLPDSITLRPTTCLQRNELVQELQDNLNGVTCLSLIDGSGKGKTQLAISLYELYDETNKYWITLRNKSDLSDKHLRVQIVRWLFQVTGESVYWQRYVLGDITFQEIVAILGETIRNSGFLIVDDLPNPVDADSLYADLEIMIKTFSEYSLKIVTTGQWDLPPSLMSRFPSLVFTHLCPNFLADEILELLKIIQIPKELQTEKIAALISATTKGHPSLVAATLSWLEKQGKEFKIEIFDDLLSGEPVKDTLEYSRKVLIKTLDDRSKELLYRLSIVGEKFNKELIFEIANVSPTISYPVEQLDRLVGPWVERLDGEYFDVSPLLSKVGEDNVPLELVKKIHAICAERYLKSSTINISELHIILLHLWQAQDYEKFTNVLVVALMTAKTYEEAKYIDWASSILLDVHWPDEIDIPWRIIIRSAQLRTLVLAKRKYKRILDDLELLLQEANIKHDASALLFSYMTISFFVVDLPLNIALPYSFKAIRLIHSSVTLRNNLTKEIINQMPDMIWTYVPRIKDRKQIEFFLNELNRLDRDIRELLIMAPLAMEASSHILDQIWLSEASKPIDQQNWHDALSFVDKLTVLSCVRESECLRVAVARAKAVIHADYLKQTDRAIEILDELMDVSSPDASFLISYSKGCFAFDEGNAFDAVKYLTVAENTGGDSFFYYRFATIRQLAISLEMQQEWNTAKQFCLRAINYFKEHKGKLNMLEFCELLGELSYIHWASENPKMACGAMHGYLKEIIKSNDTNGLRYKEVFNKAGHALGWFLSMARWESPPQKTTDGEEYAPVQPGFFGIRRTKLSEFVSPMGFSTSHLLRQLALFASGVGLMRMARNVLKLSLDRFTINDAHSQFAYVELATLETILGSPDQALKYGLNARKFFVSASMLDKEIAQSDYLNNFEELYRSSEFNVEEYRKSEERFLFIIFVPLFAKLIGSNLSAVEIRDELEKWNNEIVAIKTDLLFTEEWIKLIKYFKDLVLFWKEDGHLDNEFMLFEHNASFEIFRELLGSEKTKVGIWDAYKSQVRVAISLPKYGEYAKYMYLGIGKFVYRYWLKVAQTQRFALNHPSIFFDELTAISPNNGADTLYDVLMSAGKATGVNLSENVKNEMKKVKKMAKPWL